MAGRIPHANAPVLGQGPDLCLGHAGFDQGEPGAPFGGGLLAGAMIAEIIDVHAEGWGHASVGSERLDLIHQRGLAPVTAVALVGEVARIGQFLGPYRHPRQVPLGRESTAVVEFAGRERRRVSGRQKNVGTGQGPACGYGNEGRVDPTGEHDDGRTDVTNGLEESGLQLLQRVRHRLRLVAA